MRVRCSKCGNLLSEDYFIEWDWYEGEELVEFEERNRYKVVPRLIPADRVVVCTKCGYRIKEKDIPEKIRKVFFGR